MHNNYLDDYDLQQFNRQIENISEDDFSRPRSQSRQGPNGQGQSDESDQQRYHINQNPSNDNRRGEVSENSDLHFSSRNYKSRYKAGENCSNFIFLQGSPLTFYSGSQKLR